MISGHVVRTALYAMLLFSVGCGQNPVASLDPPMRVVLRDVGDGRITVTWSAVEGARGYRVYRSERGPSAGTYSDYLAVAAVAAETTAFSDTVSSYEIQCRYRVAVLGPGGESRLSDEYAEGAPLNTRPPARPAALIVRASNFPDLGGPVVFLDWAANPDADIDCYQLFRSEGTPEDFQLLAESPQPHYSDAAVLEGQEYRYFVVARDWGGKTSSPSAIAADRVLPAPALLSPTGNSVLSDSPVFSWSDVGATGYMLYILDSPGRGERDAVKVVGATKLQYQGQALRKMAHGEAVYVQLGAYTVDSDELGVVSPYYRYRIH